MSLRKVSFGTVLVGPNSHTVYLFLKDKAGSVIRAGSFAFRSRR